MSQQQWNEVDAYFNDRLSLPDPVLDAALETCDEARLPPHQVSPCQGKLLHLLARMQQAKSILEIGTLGGYSTIWLARALPADGHLITLELDPHHSEVARQNIARAALSHLVAHRVGAALETLPQIASEGLGPFDLTFIDADKANCPGYFDWALKLSRPGSVIIVDNVVRSGEVINDATDDEHVRGIQLLMDQLSRERRVTATAIQTVGSKGHDGFAIAIVTSTELSEEV